MEERGRLNVIFYCFVEANGERKENGVYKVFHLAHYFFFLPSKLGKKGEKMALRRKV